MPITLDTSLNIKEQAWAVFHTLCMFKENWEGAGVRDVRAYAWYNCRERGISLSVFSQHGYYNDSLVIVINEHRCSDSIVVDSYERNEPTVPSFTDAGYDAAYENRKYFGFAEVHKAVDFINTKIVQWAINREPQQKSAS